MLQFNESLKYELVSPPKKLIPYVDEAVLRAEFESMHKGRDLTRHPLRGTYYRAHIAALWNQHKRTANWLVDQLNKK